MHNDPIRIEIRVSRKSVRHAIFLAVLGCALIGGIALAVPVPHQTFSSGQTLTALQLTDNFQNIEGRLSALEKGRVSNPWPAGAVVVTAQITATAGASSCAVTQSPTWIADASQPSPGACHLAISPGIFGSTPVCTASNDDFVSTISGVSSTGLNVDVETTDGSPRAGRAIYLICVGTN
jgi:hypothetical protein